MLEKSPKFISEVFSRIFIFLGIFFLAFSFLGFVGIVKPAAESIIQSSTVFAQVFLFMGVVSVGIGMIFKMFSKKKEKFVDSLLIKGTKTVGKVEKITKNKWVRYNQTFPFVICYTYTYNNEILKGKSNLIWQQPALKIGDSINIYVDDMGKSTAKI